MSAALLVICAAAIATAAAFAVADAPPLYILGGAGRLFPSPPSGYVLATLDDIKSATFTTAYGNGLADNGETMPPQASWCPLIAVHGGALSIGTLANPSYIAPYGSTQTMENMTQLISPIWFGTFPLGSSAGQFIGQLTADVVAALHTMPVPNSLPGCASTAYYAVYIRAVFVVSGFGQDFPTPPMGAVQAGIDDLRSAAFVSQYNAGQLSEAPGTDAMNGCCVFSTADGYAYLGRNALLPYGVSNSHCGEATLTGPIWFGTPKGMIGLLNNTAVSELKARAELPEMCDASTVDTWAVYKAHPNSAPPNEGSCLEVELQVSWYVPNSVSPCLADRWRHIIRFNETYPSIAMSDFNSCGGAINIHNLLVAPYDATHYTASTTGATNCDCTATVIFPARSTSEMSTICRKTIGEFGFCDVLIDVDKRLHCP